MFKTNTLFVSHIGTPMMLTIVVGLTFFPRVGLRFSPPSKLAMITIMLHQKRLLQPLLYLPISVRHWQSVGRRKNMVTNITCIATSLRYKIYMPTIPGNLTCYGMELLLLKLLFLQSYWLILSWISLQRLAMEGNVATS